MSWIHLGDCYLFQLQFRKSVRALEVAVLKKGARAQLHRLFKARNWIADWRDRDNHLAEIEASLVDAMALDEEEAKRTAAYPGGMNALDFVELPSPLVIALSRNHAGGATDAASTPSRRRKDLDLRALRSTAARELRVGFVSSDFGVHPVATLLRGLLASLSAPSQQSPQTRVFCFALTNATSWWKRNITQTVDRMVSLVGKDPREAASVIRRHRLHVLIDLNGHTLHSGLPIFRHRPAPVQISYLGYPMTTGDASIDWVITDAVSTPVETSDASFTEKLLVLPTHYIVNDHLQMLGHTLEGARPTLASLLQLLPAPTALETRQRVALEALDDRVVVFATFSNWQKMDPPVFDAWMQILRQVPNSVMWFLRYSGHADAVERLRTEANAHGVDGDTRLLTTDLAPWINHTFVKRAADLVLDTSLKNGHTTLLDALCAGVPMLTLEGTRMSNRAGSSMLHSLDLQAATTVHSFKEYVDVAVALATTTLESRLPSDAVPAERRVLLQRLRATVEARRASYPLFDTQRYASRFRSALQTALYLATTDKSDRAMHALVAVGAHDDLISPRPFTVRSALHDDDSEVERTQASLDKRVDTPAAEDDEDEDDQEEEETEGASSASSPPAAASNAARPVLLHIGGQLGARHPDWRIVDIQPGKHVDDVLPMDDLSPSYGEHTVSAIYASHVLEHCHYGVFDQHVQRTLREWHRVLAPGGALLLAVPDLTALSRLFVNETLSDAERFFVMRVMFGGQVDAYDVHRVGFSDVILASFLEDAGFCEITRVADFGIFRDSSTISLHGVPISLNVVARACKPERPKEQWIHVKLSGLTA
ncbi:hypothetical protein PINS_up000624 [Pythium insidiosum]|nr:hypothetical protein PINS_up000624 [Pythium insidiosum]